MDPIEFHRALMRMLKHADETGDERDASVAAGLVERAIEAWSDDRFIVNVTVNRNPRKERSNVDG